jgi:hypothetical protein
MVQQFSAFKSAMEDLAIETAMQSASSASNSTANQQQPAPTSTTTTTSSSDKAQQQELGSPTTWATPSVPQAAAAVDAAAGQAAAKASGEAAAVAQAVRAEKPAEASATGSNDRSSSVGRNGRAQVIGVADKPTSRLLNEVLPSTLMDAAATAAAAEPVAITSSASEEAAVSSSAGSSGGSSRLKPCRLSDPYCFTESECYCRLPNGTFGQACPIYGSCLGACCSTSGSCPSRMGFEDQHTGQKSLLLPSSCADWGLEEGAALAAPAAAEDWASVLECRHPKGRQCVLGQVGVACMGYTECRDGGGCDGVHASVLGAMCVHKLGDSSRFDVCSCTPVY